jgi:CRP-like cAMP-binding protein
VSSLVRTVSVKAARSNKKANSGNPAFDVKLFLDSAGLGRTVVKFGAKETVFAQGDPAKNVIYIQEGGVKLTVVHETGKEAVVAILKPGDFVGEGCLAGQSICMVTATTISPTTAVVIEKHEMTRMLHKEQEFSDRFIAYMLARNIRVEEDLINQLFQRETAGAHFVVARPLWRNGPNEDDASQSIARGAGGDGWHNAVARQFFHEQIQKARFH